MYRKPLARLTRIEFRNSDFSRLTTGTARIICAPRPACFVDRLSARVPRRQNEKQKEHCHRLPCIANTDPNTYPPAELLIPLGNEPREQPRSFYLHRAPRDSLFVSRKVGWSLLFYFIPCLPCQQPNTTIGRFGSFRLTRLPIFFFFYLPSNNRMGENLSLFLLRGASLVLKVSEPTKPPPPPPPTGLGIR